MQRGWSSFADTRQITFSNTIGEDHRIMHFLAAVCRRRWPSGRRLLAPQRPSDLRTSATAIFLTRRMPDLRCSEGGRLWSEAEPAGLGGEMPHLGDDEGILARVGISLMAEVALWDDAAIYKPWSIVILLLAMRLQRIAEQVAHFELK